MLVATTWGIFEFGERDPKFRDADDPRDMQIRARSVQHLSALRENFPTLGETVFLGMGVADFQFRVYITRADLGKMMSVLAMDIDYVQFKKGAIKDSRLYGVLSDMWSVLLNAYPEGSSYRRSPYERQGKQRKQKKNWWEV